MHPEPTPQPASDHRLPRKAPPHGSTATAQATSAATSAFARPDIAPPSQTRSSPHRAPGEPIGVLIADDDPFVRDGVQRILEPIEGCRAIATAASADEILARLPEPGIDLLLLDIHIPGPGPIEIIRQAKQSHPRLRVIVFSVDLEARQTLEILDSGADGFVAKADASRELAGAFEAVTDDRRYVSSSMAQRLMEGVHARPIHGLSERELQVLRLLAEGERIRDIATSLRVSPKTISTYRARVLEKTGLHNNAELVRYALRHHLSR